MPTLIFPIGNACCGKTTYFETVIKSEYPEMIRISADEIRFEMLDYIHTGIDYDEKIESEVWKRLYDQFVNLVKQKCSIYIDCTNVSVKERSQFIIRALKHNQYKINMIWFDIPLIKSLEWNMKRTRKVYEKALINQYLRIELPSEYEYDSYKIMIYNPNTDKIELKK